MTEASEPLAVPLEDCLPEELRAARPAISRIAAGLSGAGVHRVDAAGRTFVLKLDGHRQPLDEWRASLSIQRLAGDAGVAPTVVHADERHRAVLTEFVADRSFAAFYRDPATHDAALAELARTLRRVHSLHAPGARPQDSRRFLGVVWSALDGVAMPKFVGEAIAALLDEAPPPVERAAVLCHNDVNPTNIVYDGRRVLLVDWQNAARNDPLYDLATAAMFFRMDEPACRALLAAYDGTPDAELSPRFHYDRRLAAASSGAAFLRLAHSAGHTGATADATLDSAPSLAELYRGLTTGSISLATPDGQWRFGLALVRTSVELALRGPER